MLNEVLSKEQILTPEDLAICAREVTGIKYTERALNKFPCKWRPSFDGGDDTGRDQALAVIEWLSAYCYKNAGTELAYAIAMLVHDKNINELQKLVIQLRTKL